MLGHVEAGGQKGLRRSEHRGEAEQQREHQCGLPRLAENAPSVGAEEVERGLDAAADAAPLVQFCFHKGCGLIC